MQMFFFILFSILLLSVNNIKAEPSADVNNDVSVQEVEENSDIILNFAKLKQQYLKKQYSKIVDEYEKKLIDENDNQSLLVVGMSMRNVGKVEDSIDILTNLSKSVTQKQMKERVSIELASAYYLNKENEMALNLCDNLIKTTKNSEIKKYAVDLKSDINQGKSLSFAKNKKPKIFYGSVGGSYIYDTNPNMSTTSNQIYLFGTAIDSTVTHGDSGYNLNGNLGYNIKDSSDKFSVYGNFSADFTAYKEYQNRDLLYISAFQGVSYKKNKSTFALLGTYNNMYIGLDTIDTASNYYMMIYGLNPSYTYDFGFIKSQTSYRYMKKDTKGFSGRSSNMHLFTQNFYFFATKKTMINFGGGGGFERTLDNLYDNNIYMLNVLVRQYAPYNIPMYLDLSYSFNFVNYTNYNPQSRSTRLDQYHNFKTSLHYIYRNNFDFYVSYLYSKNNSNVLLYKFDRHQIITGVRFMF